MAAQWASPRRASNSTAEPVVAAPHGGSVPDQVVLGGAPLGQPLTRVDFFRRMPAGGTAYLKPTDSED
ncbi:hypothetical protein [Amycolatopsis pithecellobii]|uniref:Uncharacterized protein n=1 Tax=Amycolatopsis pithecellobii TaxID=664692 RepID=A0A6N7Z8A2_9PSEU|nr:hypothetical protein [Amycolatopsis pithecellobii]MTD57831.1 hypothetical protein [Amycolatopsis pithecellobii]